MYDYDIPTATNADMLETILGDIRTNEEYKSLTDLQRDYLSEKAVTRYWVQQLENRGRGTDFTWHALGTLEDNKLYFNALLGHDNIGYGKVPMPWSNKSDENSVLLGSDDGNPEQQPGWRTYKEQFPLPDAETKHPDDFKYSDPDDKPKTDDKPDSSGQPAWIWGDTPFGIMWKPNQQYRGPPVPKPKNPDTKTPAVVVDDTPVVVDKVDDLVVDTTPEVAVSPWDVSFIAPKDDKTVTPPDGPPAWVWTEVILLGEPHKMWTHNPIYHGPPVPIPNYTPAGPPPTPPVGPPPPSVVDDKVVDVDNDLINQKWNEMFNTGGQTGETQTGETQTGEAAYVPKHVHLSTLENYLIHEQFDDYLALQHHEVTTGALMNQLALTAEGYVAIGGDEALEERLGLAPEIKAVTAPSGQVMTMYDASEVNPTPFSGHVDAGHSHI
jgi:hypothetical protein